MPNYEIVAEAHEGVYSVDEEILSIVEATSEIEAFKLYTVINNSVSYYKEWNCYLINNTRKVFARKVNG